MIAHFWLNTLVTLVTSPWRHRDLIPQMVRREVIGRYRGSVMGLLWSFLNPVLMLAVFTFVFSVIFKARWGVDGAESKADFALILFVGMIIHGVFAECVNRAPSLILGNVNFVKKVIFPLEILPWVAMGATLFHALVSVVVWAVFFLAVNGYLPWTIVFLPLVALPLVLLTMGFAWFLAATGVFLRDVAQTTGIFTTVLLFLSPIFYPVSALPEGYRGLLHLNPLTFLIEQAREVMVWGRVPDLLGLLLFTQVRCLSRCWGLRGSRRPAEGSRMSSEVRNVAGSGSPPQPGDVAIRVENLSKSYLIYDKPEHRLWQGLFRGRKQFFREFWALKDVSFEVRRGETVGIVGRNGSGKSTLLQLICGTLTPTTGVARVHGRVGVLLELGAGFNPEFTGRENVFLNGVLLGLTREEIEARFDSIVAFADIGDFVDQPVKTYSSGMYVRLAFAVIANIEADILVIDEALAVGDAFFTQKCMRFLRDFQSRGTILFVSHDTGAVLSLCEKALLMKGGVIVAEGPAKEVVEVYHRSLVEETQGASSGGVSLPLAAEASPPCVRVAPEASALGGEKVFRFDPDAPSFGRGGASIVSAYLAGEVGTPAAALRGGEHVRLQVRVRAHEAISGTIVGFLFKDRLGQILFGENTFGVTRANPVDLAPGETATAEFAFEMPHLLTGEYSLDLAVAEGTQTSHVQHQWFYDAMIVRVVTERPVFGLMATAHPTTRLMRETTVTEAVGVASSETGERARIAP